MENTSYDNWSREELLHEVRRLRNLAQFERLTDDRFLGEGFYQPKTLEEMREIQLKRLPSYDKIYQRLGEYERMFDNI